MSNIETFFRRCPNCGKRFEIRLVSKELIETESIKEERPITGGYFGGYPGSYVQVGETEPVYVDVEKFKYSYKCKHCGHQWVEIREKEDERKEG
ncbi:MAG TPA: hypothetical protein VN739_09510 [Nitrososphaerales archaeon]|nr:hypothetical protein [Nitrososphaerales archaeon]